MIRNPNGGVLFADRGEINNVSVAYEPAGGVYVIQDTAGIKAPGRRPVLESHGCTARSSTVVACAWPELVVELGDGDDRLTVTSAVAPRTSRSAAATSTSGHTRWRRRSG